MQLVTPVIMLLISISAVERLERRPLGRSFVAFLMLSGVPEGSHCDYPIL